MSAAIAIQRTGLSVLLVEGKKTIGGGLRSAELTLPGYIHDVCSAIHPMAVSSLYFKTFPLSEYGLQFIDPPVAAAHPFDDGTSAALKKSVEETAGLLGKDESAGYKNVVKPKQISK